MSTSPGIEAVKAVSRAHDATLARAKKTRALQAKWVLDSELTAEQLREHHRQLRADFYARNPNGFGATG